MPESHLKVTQDFVLQKCSYFQDVQLWPAAATALNPEGWLTNFLAEETECALYLLNAFMYYSEPLINQLFLASFQNISSLEPFRSDKHTWQKRWQEFFDSLYVTFVTGENPNPTDSGHSFARKARKILGLPQARIVTPEEALERVLLSRDAIVIFVDDFVGSGQQCIDTWGRTYDTRMGASSFAKACANGNGSYYYCPAVATEYGSGNIAHDCPGLVLSPGNTISSRYSAFNSQSLVWPASLSADGIEVLERASRRAGIPDNGGGEDDWRGFHKLGLTLALHDSVPDATLPIYYWERNNWIPLIRRS